MQVNRVNFMPAKAGLVSCLVLAGKVFAGQEVTDIPIDQWRIGSAALGGGLNVRQNPYRAADDVSEWQLDVVPLMLYNGKHLFSRGTAAGVHILSRRSVELNLLARARFQRLDAGGSGFYEGIESRQPTIDGGAEFLLRGGWGEFKAAWLTDLLDRHEGESVELTYRYAFDVGRLTVSPFVGWERHDDKLTNYYYGISAGEARPGRPEYAPGSSQWITLGLNSSYQLTERVMLFGNIGMRNIDPVVKQSPIVDSDTAAALYLGGTYLFGNLLEPDTHYHPERRSEWSWRVNYGYSANGNIVSEIDQGDFSNSRFADTNIAGITLGRLLSEGRHADFTARFSLYRHLEDNEGNGSFNSYAVYMETMGRGYGAWSRDEWFRWGFGFGLSFAEKVPIVEQREQADKRDKTSRLLSYLEMQIDFPLRRLFKARSLRNCYAGITIVHRSGIFGSSDFLGDVSGGSDWITAHFECAVKPAS